MPLLDDRQVQELLKDAKAFYLERDGQPGRPPRPRVAVRDYCRNCDEFYFLNEWGRHKGHRVYLRPFVEQR